VLASSFQGRQLNRHNDVFVKIRRRAFADLMVQWIAALRPGSTKAQHDPLIVPGKRQA
jgi:hypothetical protein